MTLKAFQNANAEIDRLKAINAELMAACEAVVKYDADEISYSRMLTQCRAAIAIATGGQQCKA